MKHLRSRRQCQHARKVFEISAHLGIAGVLRCPRAVGASVSSVTKRTTPTMMTTKNNLTTHQQHGTAGRVRRRNPPTLVWLWCPRASHRGALQTGVQHSLYVGTSPLSEAPLARSDEPRRITPGAFYWAPLLIACAGAHGGSEAGQENYKQQTSENYEAEKPFTHKSISSHR